MSYIISQIKMSDRRASEQQRALLSKVGLPAEQSADIILGVFDQNYELLATGSLSGNQLHSIAVDLPYRGMGLLNQIVTHLYEFRFQTGHCDLYATVSDDLHAIFKSIGFHEIKREPNSDVLMGNLHAMKMLKAKKSDSVEGVNNYLHSEYKAVLQIV